MEDCNIAKIGKANIKGNTCGDAVIGVMGNSTVTLSDSELSGNSSGHGSVYVGKDGNLTITDTVITGEAESNGLYVAAGGSVTMTGSGSALYGSRQQDVVIEESALSVSLPAVAEMNIPPDLKEEYKLWIKEGESKKGLSERLEIASAEERSAYKVSALKSDEAQIIREGEDTPILYATFVKAVQDAKNGDVIQLLPDTLDSEAVPQDRVIKLRETATIKAGCSITIDLNKQELNLSEASTDKAYISIPAGVELTVKGPGQITGGYVNNNLTGLNETVWVGSTLDGTNKAQLTITEEAYVEGIKNYGVTKVINGAQVRQIAQICASKNPEKESFVLDTELRNSLKVLLDSVVGSKNLDSKVWITVGEHFSIGESVDKIDFALSYGGSLKNPDFIKNSFIKWLNTEGAKTISLIDVSEVSKDVIKELAGMTEVSNVPIESTECTASICVVGNNIALYRNEGFVYLGGSDADDDNIGYSNTAPVATMKKAIELAQAEDAKQKIYLVGTVKVTEEQGAQTWDMPDDISLELYGEFAENGHSGPYAEVEEGGSLTLEKIEIKGAGTDATNSPLIKVDSKGLLYIREGAILSNNNYDYENLTTYGGAIYNDGGTVEMTGGRIEKCKAYNGGAVYCTQGGNFYMKGGTLTQNEAREAGGAVMLANGATMELSGNASIAENLVTKGSKREKAKGKGYGGGIAVGGFTSDSIQSTPILIMKGGIISNNRASTCGGGIFVQANATASVTGGVIYWNTADGNYVAGGGIYVNGARTEILDDDGTEGTSYPEGYLELKNALINGNIAKGGYGGGGLAACGTASAEISLLNGAAIYGNKKGEMPADYTESDIYIIRDIWSAHTEIDISEYMINGQPYLWQNYDDRTDSAASRLHKNDEIYPYHLYTDRTCIVDPSAFDVKIISNFSGGSGGGVGANGSVKIGTETEVTSISVRKVWDENGRDPKKIDSPDQIKVWLLRRKKGDSAFEQVIADYLKPNAKGEWGTITFTNQPIKSPEGVDYEYTVEEDMEGLDVYESSVERDEAAEGENNWIITNTYTPTPTTATITGTKVLTGREWADTDKFTFELTETTEPKTGETAVPDKLTEKTATATSAKKDFSFGPFTYTKPYVHTYTVRETSKSDKGITVDEKTYKVTVNVTDDGNGKLSAEVSYSQKEKNAEGKDTEIPAKKLTFTNTYTPAPTTATIAGTKVLTGREWKDSDEFTFTLTETTEPKTGETVVPDKLTEKTATATSAKKDFSFGPFTYTKPYVHTYQVVENDTSIIDITEDPTYYLVTVNVTDDGNGKLSAEVSYTQKEKDAEGKDTEIPAKKLTFTNTYTPVSTTATVDGTKVLTGREWKASDEFTFTLTETTEPKTGETVVPDKLTEKTATATSAKKDFSFGPFTYTKPYVHTYEVKETSVSGKGIKVDEKKYTVTVNVTDDGSGKLSAKVSYPQTKKNAKGEDVAEDKVIFTNTYTAESCETTVSATKTLTGRTLGLQDKEFSFSLTPVSAVAADGKTEITDPNMDAETNPGGMLTASNDGDGKVTFDPLTYTQAGTYTYELKEEATIEAGITKDPSVYTVTVNVTDDSLGNLHADVKYSKDGKEVAAADVAFENVYDAEDTSIRLGATKVFDRELKGGEFTFVLREVDQNGYAVEGGITRETVNGKDGSVLFDPIPYDKEGTYYYQISETAGSDPTVLAYDAAVHTVTVTVKDVDAKLVATADLSPDKVTFTNTSTKAYLDKQDAETGAGIPGAVLRIVDKSNGAVVEEWTSDGKPHEVLGKLSKNGSYALEEVSAPDGYLPTGPIDFTMNEKGEIVVDGQTTDIVVMKDTKNTVSLLKLDEAGQPLPGAHLVIEDATGTAVDNWVSDGTPHVTRGLARGHYVMSEVEAPAGYHVSEDVPFEITGNETQPVEVQMTDTKIPERDNNKLTVMKHLQLDGITCDIGIHDAVFYVALFDDEAKTHRVSDVKALTFKDSAISTAEFENLGKGTYYLGETDENGVLKESEVVNDRVIYYAQYGENAKVEFEGRKGEATADLTNVYVEVPEQGFYLSGRLTITKKVLLNGTEATSEDTFYARVFSDAALTSPNSDVVALAMNGGSTASVTVYDLPIGETLESSATYYVAETDKNGTPLDPDAVTEYRISIDKSEIVLNAENSNQEVTITNDFIEEEDETETETDLPDEPGATPNSGTSAPKTGDETNLLLYLFYMMLSAGLFAASAGEKRRRKGHTKK